jgi:multicomponent Na+:H+ antiporter subunit D
MPKPDPLSEQADQETEPEAEEAYLRAPAVLFLPALGLLLMGLAVGVLPGLLPSLAHAAQEAATRFLNHDAYVATVLYGLPAGQLSVTPPHTLTGTSFLYAVGSIIGALVLALLALFGRRLRHSPPRTLVAAIRDGSSRLRALHSGHPGDYVAWLMLGVAAFGVLFALALH